MLISSQDELNFVHYVNAFSYIIYRLDASQRPWERVDASEEENIMAKEAYTSLIRVTPKMPQTATINSFLESVTKIAMNEFNYTQYGRGEVSN